MAWTWREIAGTGLATRSRERQKMWQENEFVRCTPLSELETLTKYISGTVAIQAVNSRSVTGGIALVQILYVFRKATSGIRRK